MGVVGLVCGVVVKLAAMKVLRVFTDTVMLCMGTRALPPGYLATLASPLEVVGLVWQ